MSEGFDPLRDAGAELRDKDRELALACAGAAQAASEGVDWLAAHREPSPRIATLQKRLRRQAVEARRLAVAAARPMSVGVFGASQMGKSFLIGKLISPEDRPAGVVFGQGAEAVTQDFLSQVNPSGGDETTGLVTRFSLRSVDTPPGNPVVLRMMREVDVLKILANTFLFDCKGQYRIRTGGSEEEVENRTPTPERLEALADSIRGRRRDAPQPGMSVEDVYELREYVERNLSDHLLAGEEHEGYWTILEDTVPHLDAQARLEALSPLWAELEEFGDLYLRLKSALDTLGHPPRVFAPLSALADRSRGVLHVNTLRELDKEGAGTSLTVVTPSGGSGTFPTCVVTALTAELCVTLERAPWEFFTHTDLLDFPGARSRENKDVHDFLRDPSEPLARSNCYLRGKVAVLFDNYAADLDLNVMLLCSGPENQEVKSLPGLLKDWIGRTQGETPAERAGRQTGLFYCLTKCDTLFVRRVGAEDPVATRMENNLGPYTWWTEEWTPGAPFDNLFFIRNPGIEDRGLFEYAEPPAGAPEDHVPPETGLAPAFEAYLDESFRPMFLGEALVKRHVREPERKLDELLRLNDGGTSNLARALAPVCNPDLKYVQVAPRAERATDAVAAELTPFYESGDLEKRVSERRGRIRALIMALRRKPGMIGPFISDFQVEEGLMEAAYRDWRRTRVETPPERDVFSDLFGDAEDAPGAAAEPAAADADGFGPRLVEWWARHLAGKVADSPWCDRLGIEEETLRGFVEEVVVGAERRGIAAGIERRIDEFTLSSMRLDHAAGRVAIFAAFALNEEVNFPGGRDAEGSGRTEASSSGGAETILEDPREMQRVRYSYFMQWMSALEALTVANASWGAGGAVDVAANERLGAILGRLRKVER
jgi:hypothetical protein